MIHGMQVIDKPELQIDLKKLVVMSVSVLEWYCAPCNFSPSSFFV